MMRRFGLRDDQWDARRLTEDAFAKSSSSVQSPLDLKRPRAPSWPHTPHRQRRLAQLV